MTPVLVHYTCHYITCLFPKFIEKYIYEFQVIRNFNNYQHNYQLFLRPPITKKKQQHFKAVEQNNY